jgi:hypothetical protein
MEQWPLLESFQSASTGARQQVTDCVLNANPASVTHDLITTGTCAASVACAYTTEFTLVAGWLPPSLGAYMLRARWNGDSAYSNAMSASVTAQVVAEFVQPAFIAIITLFIAIINHHKPLRDCGHARGGKG